MAEEINGGSGAAQDAEPGAQPSFSILRIVLNVVTVLGILAVSVGAFIALKAMKTPPPRKPPPPINIKAQVMPVEISDHQFTVSAYGTVVVKKEILVVPQVSGELTYVHPQYTDGGIVEKGEVLFRVEQSDYSSMKAQAQAQLDAAGSDIASLESRLGVARQVFEVAKDNMRIAKEETGRIRRLHEEGVVAESSFNAQQARQNSAEMSLEQARDSVDSLARGIKKAQSAKEAALAQLEQAENQVARTEYTAPFTGRISGGKLDEGQVVGAGAQLGRLQDNSAYEIVIPMALSDWHALVPSGKTPDELAEKELGVEVRWENVEGKVYSWDARVIRVGSELDPRTRLLDVVVEVAEDMSRPVMAEDAIESRVRMVPKMFCRVVFKGPELSGVALIPRRALHSRRGVASGDDIVFVVEDGALRTRDIRVWRHTGEKLIVTHGLEPGDLVITSVVEEAVPGMPVVITSRTSD